MKNWQLLAFFCVNLCCLIIFSWIVCTKEMDWTEIELWFFSLFLFFQFQKLFLAVMEIDGEEKSSNSNVEEEEGGTTVRERGKAQNGGTIC